MASGQDSQGVLYGDLDLPEWANMDALNPRRDTDYPDRVFAEVFADINRPILTVSQVHRRLNNSPSPKTVRKRLNQLDSDGFLDSYQLADPDQDSGMGVYYLRHPDVRDPIPTELSADQLNNLTRLDAIEEENEDLREEVEKQEEELQAKTEEAKEYEQTLRRSSDTAIVTIFAVFVLLLPLVVIDGIQSVPLFFRTLAQPTVAIGLGLIVAVGTLYLIIRRSLVALGGRGFRDMLGE
jgi:hypothetical protein